MFQCGKWFLFLTVSFLLAAQPLFLGARAFALSDDDKPPAPSLSPRERDELIHKLKLLALINQIQERADHQKLSADLLDYAKKNGLTDNLTKYSVCLKKLKVTDDMDWTRGAGDLVASLIFKRPETSINLVIPGGDNEVKEEKYVGDDGKPREHLDYPSGPETFSKGRTSYFVDGPERCFVVKDSDTLRVTDFIYANSGVTWENNTPNQYTVGVPRESVLSSENIVFDLKLEDWDDHDGKDVDPIPANKDWLRIALPVDSREFYEGPHHARTYRKLFTDTDKGIEVEFEVTQWIEPSIKLFGKIGRLAETEKQIDVFLDNTTLIAGLAIRQRNLPAMIPLLAGSSLILDAYWDLLKTDVRFKDRADKLARFIAVNVAPAYLESLGNNPNAADLARVRLFFDFADLDSRDTMVKAYRAHFYQAHNEAVQAFKRIKQITKTLAELRALPESTKKQLLDGVQADSLKKYVSLRRAAALVGVGLVEEYNVTYEQAIERFRVLFEEKMAPGARAAAKR